MVGEGTPHQAFGPSGLPVQPRWQKRAVIARGPSHPLTPDQWKAAFRQGRPLCELLLLSAVVTDAVGRKGPEGGTQEQVQGGNRGGRAGREQEHGTDLWCLLTEPPLLWSCIAHFI